MKHRSFLAILFCVLGVLIGATPSALGTDWYVKGSYSGTEAGTITQPDNTLGEAAARLAASGDTIYVYGYAGTVGDDPPERARQQF